MPNGAVGMTFPKASAVSLQRVRIRVKQKRESVKLSTGFAETHVRGRAVSLVNGIQPEDVHLARLFRPFT